MKRFRGESLCTCINIIRKMIKVLQTIAYSGYDIKSSLLFN